MKPITRTIELPKDRYYEKHLEIVNPMLPLINPMTPTEIKVLALFMSLEGDITQDRFSTSARRIVMDKLKLSFGGLSNYIKSFQIKELIIPDEKTGVFIIHPSLMPDTEQEYNFKLIRNDGLQSE